MRRPRVSGALLFVALAAALPAQSSFAQWAYQCPAPQPGVPINDCATRPSIIMTDGTPVPFDTTLAGTDGPPQAACFSGNNDLQIHKDVWWRLLAPTNGSLAVSNCFTGTFDSKIAVYSIGSDPTTFDPQQLPSMFMKCNDDCTDGQFFTSEVSVSGIRAGRYYLVRLGGYEGASGTGSVRVTLVPTTSTTPDPCATGSLITGATGLNEVALPSSYAPLIMDPHCGSFGGAIYRARMVRFQPNASGIVEIGNCATSGPSSDARIAVMTACGTPATTIACNDDGCSGGPYGSRVLVNMTAGTNYYIAVGGRTETVAGPIRLSISEPCPLGLGDPAAEAICACRRSDLNASGGVDGADLGALLAFWGPRSAVFPQADITGDGMVDGADLGVLLNSWGGCD